MDRRGRISRRLQPARRIEPAEAAQAEANADAEAQSNTDRHADTGPQPDTRDHSNPNAGPDTDACAVTNPACSRRATLPGAPNCPIFPTTNVWNVPINGRPVAADSATLISTIGLDRGLHMDFGSFAGYGIPYNIVDSSTPRSTVACSLK